MSYVLSDFARCIDVSAVQDSSRNVKSVRDQMKHSHRIALMQEKKELGVILRLFLIYTYFVILQLSGSLCPTLWWSWYPIIRQYNLTLGQRWFCVLWKRITASFLRFDINISRYLLAINYYLISLIIIINIIYINLINNNVLYLKRISHIFMQSVLNTTN